MSRFQRDKVGNLGLAQIKCLIRGDDIFLFELYWNKSRLGASL